MARSVARSSPEESRTAGHSHRRHNARHAPRSRPPSDGRGVWGDELSGTYMSGSVRIAGGRPSNPLGPTCATPPTTGSATTIGSVLRGGLGRIAGTSGGKSKLSPVAAPDAGTGNATATPTPGVRPAASWYSFAAAMPATTAASAAATCSRPAVTVASGVTRPQRSSERRGGPPCELGPSAPTPRRTPSVEPPRTRSLTCGPLSRLAAGPATARTRGAHGPRPACPRGQRPTAKTEDGIADIGLAWAARIIDPGKNALGIVWAQGDGLEVQTPHHKVTGGLDTAHRACEVGGGPDDRAHGCRQEAPAYDQVPLSYRAESGCRAAPDAVEEARCDGYTDSSYRW